MSEGGQIRLVLSPWELEIGSRTLWQEARGEPEEGQRAVAHVLVNRLRAGHWGKDLASVCLYPLQFSGWNAHDPNRLASVALPSLDPALTALRGVLLSALSEADLTQGAMWYHAQSLRPVPVWAQGPSALVTGVFGHQVFYKGIIA